MSILSLENNFLSSRYMWVSILSSFLYRWMISHNVLLLKFTIRAVSPVAFLLFNGKSRIASARRLYFYPWFHVLSLLRPYCLPSMHRLWRFWEYQLLEGFVYKQMFIIVRIFLWCKNHCKWSSELKYTSLEHFFIIWLQIFIIRLFLNNKISKR